MTHRAVHAMGVGVCGSERGWLRRCLCDLGVLVVMLHVLRLVPLLLLLVVMWLWQLLKVVRCGIVHVLLVVHSLLRVIGVRQLHTPCLLLILLWVLLLPGLLLCVCRGVRLWVLCPVGVGRAGWLLWPQTVCPTEHVVL